MPFISSRRGLCNRRDFLQAASAMTISAPVWLTLSRAPALAQAAPLSSSSPALKNYFEAALGITSADQERLLKEALAKGGDLAEVFFQHIVGTWIIMEDEKVNRAYSSINLGMGVRVIRGEKTGYAFSQVLEMPAMLQTARAAAALARAGKQAPGQKGVVVHALQDKPGLDVYPTQEPWALVSGERRLDLLRRVGRRLAGADASIIKTVLQFHDSTSQVLVANSEGVRRWDVRPRTSLYASCVAQKKGRRESNYADAAMRAGLEFYTPELLDRLADEAAARTLRLFQARPLAPGEMPCVLAPGSAGILLHEAIGHGLEADFNRRGISTYAGRLGQRVADPQVTVVDDGTIPNSHGALSFDDEGGDSQRTVLVDKGVLRSYLHDRLSAAWYQTQTTGSGRRQSYQYPPIPRMRATFMEPGKYDPQEVLGQVKKGIYAEQLSNGQVNIGAGDFSFYIKSGWAIENGRLTHPVKDINLTGNGPQVLSRISMVADDLALAESGFMCGKLGQTVPVSQGLPTTLVSSINVGSAGTGS
ncbi:MAG: TldD/PmbA family protein [Desulfarculaceae bacterium]